ncbi:MAG: ABC transporter ATP-binding protein [Alphaproteobacteria bacterium]|nr:ABC transporter ATP-binding protein [Alphaproteobacteria bacterium]
MTHLAIRGLTKRFSGQTEAAVADLNLEIESGSLVALLGPSGCGKTTTMKMVAGLLEPTAGDILFDEKSIINIAPERRGAVMVFQNYLLFPYMTIAQNVGYGLKIRKVDRAIIDQRVSEILEMVRLPGIESRRPSELSGGQQQRVALARALVVEPRLLLLDEPLSNLDAHLRFELRDLIRDIQQKMGITTVFVTHDQEEAVVLADKVALILDGRLRQYADADVFYKRPADEATARFFGGQNFISGTSANGTFEAALGSLKLPSDAPEGTGILTFRPENVRIGAAADGENTLQAKLTDKIFLGTQTRLKLAVGDDIITAIANPNDVEGYLVDQEVPLSLPPATLWVLTK